MMLTKLILLNWCTFYLALALVRVDLSIILAAYLRLFFRFVTS